MNTQIREKSFNVIQRINIQLISVTISLSQEVFSSSRLLQPFLGFILIASRIIVIIVVEVVIEKTILLFLLTAGNRSILRQIIFDPLYSFITSFQSFLIRNPCKNFLEIIILDLIPEHYYTEISSHIMKELILIHFAKLFISFLLQDDEDVDFTFRFNVTRNQFFHRGNEINRGKEILDRFLFIIHCSRIEIIGLLTV